MSDYLLEPNETIEIICDQHIFITLRHERNIIINNIKTGRFYNVSDNFKDKFTIKESYLSQFYDEYNESVK